MDVDIEPRQVAVILTDHPYREGTQPIVAEVHSDTRSAAVSLPSLGAVRVRERAARAVERVMTEPCGDGTDGAQRGL